MISRRVAILTAAIFLAPSIFAPCLAMTVKKVNVAIFDLVCSPADGSIYASVKGGIIRIDPTTGKTDPLFAVAGQPTKIVISDDGQFIHALTDGTNSIARLNLSTMQVDLQFQADTSPGQFHRKAWDIAAVPGRPTAVLVSRYYPCCSPPGGGIVAFDDGVLLPKESQGQLGSSEGEKLAFDEVAERGFAYERALSTHHFLALRVEADGVVAFNAIEGLLTGNETSIWAGGGNVYTNYGPVVDSTSLKTVGTIGSGMPWPDPIAGRVFVLSIENPGVSVIKSYDQSTFKVLQTIKVPGTGDTGALHRFGERGLAFASTSTVYIVEEDLVLSPLKKPFRRGHVLQTAKVRITDAVITLSYIFAGLAIPCPKSADVDDDGKVNVGDAVYILRYVFQHGPPPSPPFTECGLDPTTDKIPCDSYLCN